MNGRRKIMGRILLICTMWEVAALPAILLSSYLSPTEIGYASLCWFAFPYLWLLMGISAILLCCFRRHIAAILYFAVLIVCAPHASRVICFYSTTDTPSDDMKDLAHISFMTYNVHYMLYYSEIEQKHYADSLMVFLHSQAPDIVCVQEAPVKAYMYHKTLKKLKQFIDKEYPHRSFISQQNGNQLILSHYPITVVDEKTLAGAGKNGLRGVQVCDVKISGNRKIRIFNCHLASIALSGDQIESVTSKNVDKKRVKTLRTTCDKLLAASKIRSSEVSRISWAIEDSPCPVIVCGDFNDTPISYSYNKMIQTRSKSDEEGTLNDAFRPHRLGLANTYRGKLPPLRIDYIFTSNRLTTANYREYDLPFSDHKALSATVYYREE